MTAAQELPHWCSQCGRGFADQSFSECRLHQCAGCRHAIEIEDRIDHVTCNNPASINFDGPVEAAGCCDEFERAKQ